MRNQRGFSLIELLVVVIMIGIIAAIAIPSLLSARKSANEASAVQTLRTIHSAQVTYFATRGGAYGDYDTLRGAGLLDASFAGASVTKSGYTIAESVATSTYCASATPTDTTNAKYYGVDESGVIYKSTVSTEIDCTSGALTTSGGAAPID